MALVRQHSSSVTLCDGRTQAVQRIKHGTVPSGSQLIGGTDKTDGIEWVLHYTSSAIIWVLVVDLCRLWFQRCPARLCLDNYRSEVMTEFLRTNSLKTDAKDLNSSLTSMTATTWQISQIRSRNKCSQCSQKLVTFQQQLKVGEQQLLSERH